MPQVSAQQHSINIETVVTLPAPTGKALKFYIALNQDVLNLFSFIELKFIFFLFVLDLFLLLRLGLFLICSPTLSKNESQVLINRGGVEDTRLEAKAKDTKKIAAQGQGQPFRGQTL